MRLLLVRKNLTSYGLAPQSADLTDFLGGHFQELGYHIPQHPFGKCAYLAVDNFSAKNKQHGRDALNAVLGGPLGVFVGIHFSYNYFVWHFLGDFIQYRPDHFARAAPGSPEINDDRQGIL